MAKRWGKRNSRVDAGAIVDHRQPESGQGGASMLTMAMPRADQGMMKFKVPVALEVETGDAERDHGQTDDTKEAEKTQDENKHATQELSQQAKDIEVPAADDVETVHCPLRGGSDGANAQAQEQRISQLGNTSMTVHQEHLAPSSGDTPNAPKRAVGQVANDADASEEDSKHHHHTQGPLRDVSMTNIERNYDDMMEPGRREHQQQDATSGKNEGDPRTDSQVRSDLGTVKVVRGQRFATIDTIVRNQELQDASRSQA